MMKRAFDIIVSAVLLVLLSPILLVVAGLILLQDGAPVFYISERMKTVERPFRLIKFRTMTTVKKGEFNDGVSGGDKSSRITPIGKVLRRFRIDELPQLVNVLIGDMSLVGPRPPLRRYTDLFPDLYREVLICRPGITGMASIIYHRHEERLIAGARTAEQTEQIYTRRCIPWKARLDLIYRDNQSIRLDIWLLWLTAAKVFGLPGRNR